MTDSEPSGDPAPAASPAQRLSTPGLFAYGVEAPYVPLLLTVGGVLLLSAAGAFGDIWLLLAALIVLAQAGVFLHTTTRGKLRAWDRLLDDLDLTGQESALDLGCGRGAVAIAVAGRLPGGTVVGIDLWRSKDQTGNRPLAAERNARVAGVSARVRFDTGDMTNLPYEDEAFDLVTSALAIHNIPTAEGRKTAMREALRVLRPGGRMVVVDFRHVAGYRQVVADQRDVTVRRLGPSYWYGGPWAAASALLATKF